MNAFFRLASVAWRESRSARRRLLLYMSSITLGVAALVAIDSFAANATQAVHDQSRALLGGDVQLSPRDTFTAAVKQLFDSLTAKGYGFATQVTMPSMATRAASAPGGGGIRLVQLRAVSVGYPFYGEIETEPAGAYGKIHSGPNAVVDQAVLVALNAHVGDSITLGARQFAIVGTLKSVPGEAGVAAMVGPRVYVGDTFLATTGLLTFGSVAQRDALVRVPAGAAPADFTRANGAFLAKNRVRMRTTSQTEANLSEAIDQLRNFLGLVGLIALFLGGIGVASGVNAFVLQKIDTVAVLRCLGATSGQVVVIYVLQATGMGIVGSAAGALLGIVAQFTLPRLWSDFLPSGVTITLVPHAVMLGFAIGLWVAIIFALRPLLGIRRISPLQTLRRDADAVVLRQLRRDSSTGVVTFAAVASIFALTIWRSDELRFGVGYGVALFLAVGVLAAVSAAMTALAKRSVRASWPFAFRNAIAGLSRPGNQTRSVVLSLGFGVFLVSTLYQVRAALLGKLDLQLANLKANVVFFDVQASQADSVDAIIRRDGDQIVSRIPMIRARMVAVNSIPVESLTVAASALPDTLGVRGRAPLGGQGDGSGGRGRGGDRGRRRFQRVWDVTYADSLSGGDRLVAGTWFAPKSKDAAVSVDSNVAASLHVGVGDRLSWDVQGAPVESKITSIHAIDRTQVKPSFQFIFSPAAMAGAPAMFVFLADAPDARSSATLERDVVKQNPTVSAVDLAMVEESVGKILNRVTTAMRLIAFLSILLSVPVLFSAVAATRRERLREGVLYKTLGATRQQVGRMLLVEYLVLGLLGSAGGTLLSMGSAWGLLHYVFVVPFKAAIAPAALVCLGMTLVAIAIGWLTGRDVFSTTPLAALRET